MRLHLLQLTFFYVLEGIPYGLQSRFLPLVLRAHGSSLTALGFYKLLYLPWVLKSFYAPFVDTCGTKRQWLLISLIGLFACSLMLAANPAMFLKQNYELSPKNWFTGILSAFWLPACLLFFNLAAATQDIAVDSLAISVLANSELMNGNIAQVVGYKLGAVVGGGLLTWLFSFIDLAILLMGLCALYAFGFIIAFKFLDFDRKKYHKVAATICTDVTQDGATINSTPSKESKSGCYLTVLRSAFCDSQSTPSFLTLLLVYKLGEQGALNMMPLMLLDAGAGLHKVGFWTGIVGQVVSVSSSALAGAFVSRFRKTVYALQRLFVYRTIILALTAIYAPFVTCINCYFEVGVLLMNATLLVSGTVTTTIFTLMMECTQVQIPGNAQATHYTILSTAEVLGKLIFGVVSSPITDFIGYPLAYVIFFALSMLPVYLLHSRCHKFTFLS